MKIDTTITGTRDGDGVDRFYLMFSVYGTVAFDRPIMRQLIGFGYAMYDIDGKLVGFDRSRAPGMLNVGPWLSVVPIAYRDDCEFGSMYRVWDRFLMRQIRDYDATLEEYIDELREWIATHVVPTDDPRPRLERFASALAEAAIQSAYDEHRISRDEADRLHHMIPSSRE